MRLAAQKISPTVMVLVVALTAATVWIVPVEFIPYWLGGIGGVAGFAAYVVLGDPLVAVLAWFVSLTCLHEEFARLILPGFFNLTIPRVFIVVLAIGLAAMVAAGRIRIRWARQAAVPMGLILIYFTVSAAVSGFRTASIITVHYRLISGYWFAFLAFFLLVQFIRTDVDIRRILIFFFVLGLYLTFTGWAEQFKLWSLVWPRFIADPTKGIHWGRVRGPFLMSMEMGLVLVFAFYGNLVLARMSGTGLCWTARFACLAMLPVIFWTQTRSVWLAMLVGGALWLGWSRRGLTRIVSLSLVVAVLVVGAAVNWRRIVSPQREVGGVTALEPIHVRVGLLMITWDMFKDRPVFGVGFGHFRDYAPRYATDPASPYHRFAALAVQHSNFLSILSECGLVGLVLYVWLLVALFRASVRVYRRLPPTGAEPINRDLVVLYWILFVSYLIHAAFIETSHAVISNPLFFGLSAIVFALDYALGPYPLPEPRSDEAKPPPVPIRA